MLIGGIGTPEIVIILLFLTIVFGVPIAAMVALILILNRRKK